MEQVTISSVEGNQQSLDGGAMFANAPKLVWQKWMTPDPANRITLACRGFVAKIRSQVWLFETGIGAYMEPKLASRFGVHQRDHVLLQSLKALSLEPEDIDVIVLSHLHFDHAGGLLTAYTEGGSGELQLAFPRAKILVGEQAFERALNPHPRDRASFIPGLTELIQDKIELIHSEGDYEDFPVRFYFSEGHTPGQMHSLVLGNDRDLFFCGDMIPGCAWVHLPITMGYDRYPEKLIDEKASFYKRLDLSRTLFFFTHDPKYAAVEIGINQKNRYEPIKFHELLKDHRL